MVYYVSTLYVAIVSALYVVVTLYDYYTAGVIVATYTNEIDRWIDR